MNRKKSLLIVEDDPDVARSLGIRLALEFETCFARDGISALGQARANKPDVILLDLGLPGGDGFRVLECLRDNLDLSNTPTIVLTGRESRGVEAKALDLGAVAFFNKPADYQDLLQTIRHLAQQPRVRKKRVLVVDDDPDLCQGMAVRLRARELEVVCASDGATALLAARKHQPDLILLDLGLPAGDGFTVLGRMKQIDDLVDTPVIVLSGREAQGNRKQALAAGARAFFEKPASESDLFETIEALL